MTDQKPDTMTYEEDIAKAIEHLEQKKGCIMFQNYSATRIISPVAYYSYKATGIPLFKVDQNGLWIAKGREYEYAPFGTFVIQLIPF